MSTPTWPSSGPSGPSWGGPSRGGGGLPPAFPTAFPHQTTSAPPPLNPQQGIGPAPAWSGGQAPAVGPGRPGRARAVGAALGGAAVGAALAGPQAVAHAAHRAQVTSKRAVRQALPWVALVLETALSITLGWCIKSTLSSVRLETAAMIVPIVSSRAQLAGWVVLGLVITFFLSITALAVTRQKLFGTLVLLFALVFPWLCVYLGFTMGWNDLSTHLSQVAANGASVADEVSRRLEQLDLGALGPILEILIRLFKQ